MPTPGAGALRPLHPLHGLGEPSESDPYWDSIAVGRALEGRAMDVPMLHFGGWYDFMLPGALRLYHEAAARTSEPQKLIVGPWTHMPWGRRVGAMDFGPEAHGLADRLQVAWFDRFLKNIDNAVERLPAVRLFDVVAKRWRDFEVLALPGAARALYAHRRVGCDFGQRRLGCRRAERRGD